METSSRSVWIELDEWIPGFEQDDQYYTTDKQLIKYDPKNPPTVVDRIPDSGVLVDDFVQLPHLHEAAVIHNIKQRYRADLIYSYNGPMLIAVNPFKQLDIYNNEAYELFLDGSDKPHVFGVANKAYRAMMETGNPQTILASGESGSGKTVTSKLLMKFLSQVSKSISTTDFPIEKMILLSNPLLEAFGNARTLMNDNSSRFGKFIRINFTPDGRIDGGQLSTYLLEKIRTVHQSAGERNFHIFYQLIKGTDRDQKDRWRLHNRMSDYNIISDPSVTNRRDGIDDGDEFLLTLNCFSKLGFSESEVDSCMKTVSGLLKLGNLQFHETEEGTIRMEHDQEAIDASYCLSIPIELLEKKLCYRQIHVADETITKPLGMEEVVQVQLTLIQTMYHHLFNWIVDKINQAVVSPGPSSDPDSKSERFIGILDIFGFEIFKHNSLEQLHINYTNESLQHLFNEFIFKMEQAEYVKEGIDWNMIDFPDNSDRLKLIGGKLFGQLNDQCLAPQGTDQRLFNRIKQIDSNHLKFNRIDRQLRFRFHHYAGWVEYSTHQFCDKNQLQVNNEITELIRMIPLPLMESGSALKTTSGRMKSTTTSLFTKQLSGLVRLIKKTSPHYVRCLKPNDENTADLFVPQRIVQQLRYSGVMEAIKVARAGYQVRFSRKLFEWRYRCLTSNGINLDSLADITYGRTKMFLKQEQYNILEKHRSTRVHQLVSKVQAEQRRRIMEKWYQGTLKNILTVQSIIRRRLAINHVTRLRQEQAAVLIGSWGRMIIDRRRYVQYRSGMILFQRLFHRYINRLELHRNSQAILLQRMVRNYLRVQQLRRRSANLIGSVWRMVVVRRGYESQLSSLVTIQRWYRGEKRRRRFKRINNLGELNRRIDTLQEQLAELISLKQEFQRKDVEIKQSHEVNRELCQKMDKIMVQNFELKTQLEIEKKKGWLARLFGR